MTKLLYVEPQAELTYTYIDGDSFKLGYADYETDAADSLVGRAGFALGIKCPNNKGDATYVCPPCMNSSVIRQSQPGAATPSIQRNSTAKIPGSSTASVRATM